MASYTSPLERLTRGKRLERIIPARREPIAPDLGLPVGAQAPSQPPLNLGGNGAAPPPTELTLRPEDVPMPEPIRGAEESRPPGFGRQLLQGFQKLIPYIGEIARGAAEGGRETDFISGLGRAYASAEQRPYEIMAAEADYLKGLADIEATGAQTEERLAKAGKARVETANLPYDLETQRELRRAQSTLARAKSESEKISSRLKERMEPHEVAALQMKLELDRLRKEKGQFENENAQELFDARINALEALMEQRQAAGNLAATRAEQLPTQVGIAGRRASAAEQANVLRERQIDELTGKSKVFDAQMKLLNQERQISQQYSDAKTEVLQSIGYATATPEEKAKMVAEVDEQFLPLLEQIKQLRQGLTQQPGQPSGLPTDGGGSAEDPFGLR